MANLPRKRNLTFEDVNYYKEDFENLIYICEAFPITMEEIVKISTVLGKLAFYGKLDVYKRVLYDASRVE